LILKRFEEVAARTGCLPGGRELGSRRWKGLNLKSVGARI